MRRQGRTSTNPIEFDDRHRPVDLPNVKRWQNGGMCLRWTAAEMLEAERQLRKIIGYQHLAALIIAAEQDLAATRAQTTIQTISPTNNTTSTTTTEPAASLATAH